MSLTVHDPYQIPNATSNLRPSVVYDPTRAMGYVAFKGAGKDTQSVFIAEGPLTSIANVGMTSVKADEEPTIASIPGSSGNALVLAIRSLSSPTMYTRSRGAWQGGFSINPPTWKNMLLTYLPTSICVAPFGTFMAFKGYGRNGGGTQSVYVANIHPSLTHAPGGIFTFEPVPVQLPNATTDLGPSICTNGETLYVVFKGAGAFSTESVFFTYSHDQGRSWSDPYMLPDCTTNLSPCIAYANGKIWVAFKGAGSITSTESIFLISGTPWDADRPWDNGPSMLSGKTNLSPTIATDGRALAIAFKGAGTGTQSMYIQALTPR